PLPDLFGVETGAGAEVERAVHDRQRAPDQFAAEVGVRRDWPARPLGPGREVERVDATERIGGVDRMRCEVDDRRPGHPVAIDLLADALELAELDPPPG